MTKTPVCEVGHKLAPYGGHCQPPTQSLNVHKLIGRVSPKQNNGEGLLRLLVLLHPQHLHKALPTTLRVPERRPIPKRLRRGVYICYVYCITWSYNGFCMSSCIASCAHFYILAAKRERMYKRRGL